MTFTREDAERLGWTFLHDPGVNEQRFEVGPAEPVWAAEKVIHGRPRRESASTLKHLLLAIEDTERRAAQSTPAVVSVRTGLK